MKQFRTIQDALDYQVYCPMCSARLEIGRGKVDILIDKYDNHTTLSWSSYDSKLVIDLETNSLISYSLTRDMSPVYGIGSNSPVSHVPGRSSNLTTDGHIIERILVGCERCFQYEYIVQVVVGFKESRIVGLFLNSEFLTIDEKGSTHEIRNVYSFGKTEYNRFVSKAEDIYATAVGNDTIILPLIPLDLEQPYKTLERIKTLILFS